MNVDKRATANLEAMRVRKAENAEKDMRRIIRSIKRRGKRTQRVFTPIYGSVRPKKGKHGMHFQVLVAGVSIGTFPTMPEAETIREKAASFYMLHQQYLFAKGK